MVRDPQGRMLVLGLALAALANVLLTIPAVIAGIPFAVPLLAVAIVAGLALACLNGVAIAKRHRERPPHRYHRPTARTPGQRAIERSGLPHRGGGSRLTRCTGAR